MRHAYLIMAHKNPSQLYRLLKLLDSKYNDIYIHIDRRSKSLFSNFIIPPMFSNVVFIPSNHVIWGDRSQIDCELDLLQYATQTYHNYYHLISGLDLPIKSNIYIYNFFEENNGLEFVHFTECGITKDHKAELYERISLYHPLQRYFGRNQLLFNSLIRPIELSLGIDRHKNETIRIAKGANWFSITHNLALHILSLRHQIEAMYKSTLCADEIFLQTIVFNSPFKDNLYYKGFDNNYIDIMRLIDWKRGSPYIFKADDYDSIMKSNMLFARKFDTSVDLNIIDEIASKIINDNSR